MNRRVGVINQTLRMRSYLPIKQLMYSINFVKIRPLF